MEDFEKNFCSLPSKEKNPCMARSENQKTHASVVQPNKILTNHRRPIPTCGLPNLSRLKTSYALLFNKASFLKNGSLLSS